MMGMGFGIGGFGMILGWIIILGVVALLIKFLWDPDRRGKATSSPMEILKNRYARGEISKMEYENMKKDLMGI